MPSPGKSITRVTGLRGRFFGRELEAEGRFGSDKSQRWRLQIASCAWGHSDTIRTHEVQTDLIPYPQFLDHWAHEFILNHGVLLRLSDIAVIPCTARSGALGSHVDVEGPMVVDLMWACSRPRRGTEGLGYNLRSPPNET